MSQRESPGDFARASLKQGDKTMTEVFNAPKPGTKEAALVKALTGRGKTIDQLSALMSWQPHTARAAFTRLRARGYHVARVPTTEKSAARFHPDHFKS